ncbi:hypothetical protein JXB31_02850 [Candidatus Woesearchaeota archaeon]|nr:hypothetical protein [Candidatus Woesearchaeota archaeon]
MPKSERHIRLERYILKYTNTSISLGSLEKDDAFKPYLMAPDYIIRYLRAFHICFDKDKTDERLTIFYAWLKAVDSLIDNNKTDGMEYYKLFVEPENRHKNDLPSLLTVSLSICSHTQKSALSKTLKSLYAVAIKEKRSKNIREYISRKRQCGRLCATATVELISDIAYFPDKRFYDFFNDFGSTAQLMDASIDFRNDQKNKEINFIPRPMDYLYLYSTLLKEMSCLIIKHLFILKGMPGFILRLHKANNNTKKEQEAKKAGS